MSVERTAAVYVPLDRRLAIASGSDLEQSQTGTALFADVAGFTLLTETAVLELGRHQGADALTAVLESLFQAIVDPVTARGGSVIEFLGDAFVAWFTGPDAAASAVAAGRAMQLAIADMPPAHVGTTSFPLNLKVGIGSGTALRFLLGVPDHTQFDSLAGPALDSALSCEAVCEHGEVVIDAVTLASAGVAPIEVRTSETTPLFSIGVEPPEDHPTPPELPDVDASYALTRVPHVVRDDVARGTFHPDIRPAVVLFMAFDGIDPTTTGIDGLTKVTEWAQELVDGHGGSVMRSGDGDKGTHLLATFGAPSAIDRLDEQAVATAAKLLDIVTVFAPVQEARIGLTIGPIYSGEYGGTNRRVLSVRGSAVNLAARLMNAATPGTALVQQELAERVARLHTFGPAEGYQLKGFPDQIFARSLERSTTTAARAATSRSSFKLVGRDSEREQIVAFLDDPATPSPILLVGEAGVGKSRLIAETLRLAAQRQIPTLTGGADVTQRLAPFHAFRSVFNQLLNIESPLPFEELKLRIANASDGVENLDAVLHGLATVLPLERHTDEERPSGPQPDLSNDSIDLLLGIVQLALERVPRALLVLDDGHWFDPSSWELLGSLAELVPNLRVIVGSRFTDSPLSMDTIDLGPLPSEASAALVAEVVGARELEPGLLEHITSRTGGHAMFIVEMTTALARSGTITVLDDVAGLTGLLGEDTLPDTLREVVIGRVDGLSADARQVLRAASVLGTTGTLAVLQTVANITGTRFDDAVSELETESLLDIVASGWALRHALFGDAVYESLVGPLRTGMHILSAEYLVMHPDEASPAAVGRHFELAGDAVRAAEQLLAACMMSLSAGSFDEVKKLAKHGVSLLERLDDPVALRLTAQLLITQASATMVTVGQFAPEVRAIYARALDVCNRLEATPDLLGALFGLSAHYAFSGEYEAAATQAQRCLDLSLEMGAPDGEGNAHMLLSMIRTWQGDHETADRHSQRVMAMTAQMTDAEVARFAQHPVVTVMIAYGISLGVRGRVDDARAAVEKAFTTAEELSHPYSIAMAHTANVSAIIAMRDVESMRSGGEALLDVATSLGLVPSIHTARSALATAMVHEGRVDEATEAMLALTPDWEAHGSKLGLTDHYIRTADALVASGRLDEAQDIIDIALAAEEANPGLYMAEALRTAGRVSALRLALAPDRARALYERAVEVASASGALLHEILALTDLTELVGNVEGENTPAQRLAERLEWIDPNDSANALSGIVNARATLARLSSEGQ